MTRDELTELVTRLMTAQGTEEQLDADLERLRESVPHPSPGGFLADTTREWTSEEIVEACLAYRPIVLGPGTEHEDV